MMTKQCVRADLVKVVLIWLMAFGGSAALGAKGNATPPPLAQDPTPIQIFGVWHCGNHYCDWNEDINMVEFGKTNDWLLERGGDEPDSTMPAVNLVVLSFVNPLKLLNGTDTGLEGMIPKGMTQDVVNYFKGRGIRVMLSIGGITYTDDWDAALAKDPEQLAFNAAKIAIAMGVGIEIDYENSSSPNIPALERFIARETLIYSPHSARHVHA